MNAKLILKIKKSLFSKFKAARFWFFQVRTKFEWFAKYRFFSMIWMLLASLNKDLLLFSPSGPSQELTSSRTSLFFIFFMIIFIRASLIVSIWWFRTGPFGWRALLSENYVNRGHYGFLSMLPFIAFISFAYILLFRDSFLLE